MALPEWRNMLAPASMARIFPAQSKNVKRVKPEVGPARKCIRAVTFAWLGTGLALAVRDPDCVWTPRCYFSPGYGVRLRQKIQKAAASMPPPAR